MENLGIDIRLIGSQLLNFLVFFFIFQKFIAKPFFNYLNSEKTKDEEKEVMMKKLQEGEATLATQEKEMRKKAKEEADAIIAKAKESAAKQKEEILANAHKEAEQVMIKAKEQMEAEKESMYKDVKNKVITVSTLMVQKGLEDYLSEDAQKQVTQNVLKHLPEKFTA